MNATELGIVLAVASLVLGIILWAIPREVITNLLKKFSIQSHVEKLHLRTDFRIAIVDDEIDNYPIQYIKNLGFDVHTYESASFADAQNLVKHDLLLLDVKGVIKEDLDEGGAKLIKIIKEARPFIPVVAVSSGYFHTELNDYFRISDATVNKPIDEYKIRELLCELKKEFFDALSIAKAIEDSIKKLDISSSKKNQLNKSIIDFLSGKSSENDFLSVIHMSAKGESQEIINNTKILLDRVQYDKSDYRK
ncbi:hypothetical protein UB37_18120 [Photobacterium iliopiscarium]|uniref:Response regulatory domain-containing protein n=1 Tax=Photobacterium iliopiscarium TaxID=56192 RepID=A0ABX5GML3_9GAMM|nr:hypothetical protein [Photobacterium iliopiscarium]KJG19469.1 hypothetical protein UB37_18120 [Photobacterium iliopiscarium]PSW91326.1 hypothetical protein C9J52_19265 [Photobacterium iliopiscarium]